MTWQRLEGLGVSGDLTPGLQARIADPLWLLARQWQTGEFAGEDAASPVALEAVASFHRIGEVRLRDSEIHAIADGQAPLETRIECESVWRGPAHVRASAESGLQLLRLAADAGIPPDPRARLRAEWPLRLGPDDGLDPRGRAELELLAHRSFDGVALAAALRAGARPDPEIAPVVAAWLAGQAALFAEPPGRTPSAWVSERMEYRFEIAAPTFASGTRLRAREYPGGHLDWDAFELRPADPPGLAEGSNTRRIKTVPIPLRYAGMPAPRWWAFEDGDVYWGDVEGGAEDLARYLVGSFATVYGDDWYLAPLEFPRGSLAQVTSVEVLDSFGQRFTIESTAVSDHKRVGDARTFRWFELSGEPAPGKGLSPRLYLPAALPAHEEGAPVEEVVFVRDEGANLAWAIEQTIESPAGRPVSRVREEVIDDPPVPARGAWGYDLATSVPPWFVPLLPVRIRGTAPAMRFQRGRMKTSGGSTGARGVLLEPEHRLLIAEHEVPASGARVTRAYQMARGTDGSVHVWVGRRKQSGRLPATVGLAHDVLTITEET